MVIIKFIIKLNKLKIGRLPRTDRQTDRQTNQQTNKAYFQCLSQQLTAKMNEFIADISMGSQA